ncbi:pilus assembly protein TadG-related protein [Sphingomonas sp. ERG5]|uniref:pilus assembly protein TadG-related protein n=1 Tax=Sphingomonas sp. ERG5 TaxID=1381597 RepID=UPI00054C1881|nr:pilus assembly protein TadG-related protein [Sphingomonas sp. ERG5]
MKRFVKSRLAGDRRGGVGLIAAAAIPMVLGFAAFAVDIGSATLETRRLQGLADAAALAAAADPQQAQALAEASVAEAGWPRAVTVVTTRGNYTSDPSVAPSARFTPNNAATDAVRVSLQTPSPTYFARAFGQTSIPIARSATAARERLAAFSVGSRLASLNGGLLNSYLSALTGSTLSLSVMDYNSLAGVDVDLFSTLDALRTTANINAATYQDILNAQVTRSQLLSALARALDSSNASAAGAMRTMAAQVSGGSIQLNTLIDPGTFGNQGSGGNGLVKVDSMAFVTAALQLAAPSRQVSLDLGASVAGLVSTKVMIAVGERPAQSPWITVTDNGAPIIRTAQARIYTEVQVGNLSLPLIGTLVAIRVPLFVELASAEARLSSIDCSTQASRGVTIEARPNPGQAALAAIDTSQFDNFQRPVALSDARILDTLLLDVDGRAGLNLGQAEPWQSLRFDNAAITAGTPKTVSSSSAVGGIAASLMSNVTLTPHLLGLPLPLGGLLSAVGSQLTILAPIVDGLLNTVTGALGVHYGEADVRVTGMRCGMASLVA